MTFWMGAALLGYLAIMFGLALFAKGEVKGPEDFLVAGRRLPLPMATATLVATWFGAGTLLTVTDEVRNVGLRVTAMDPLGAGLCLALAGLFFARPLWEMKICTVSDFYARRFGPRAEFWSAVVLIPSYFGWIAAQLVAVAKILEMFFGLDPAWGILLVAFVTGLYTMLGGMWAVTITDFAQLALIALGLGWLGWDTLSAVGGGSAVAGLAAVAAKSPPERLVIVPTATLREFTGWLSLLAVGALGNLPGQDLTQRIFSSRSAATARRACLLGGAIYLAMGLVPAAIGLAGGLLLPATVVDSILPRLAADILPPFMTVIFLVTVLSAVMSTIDSAILAPAGVLAQNLLKPRLGDRHSDLALNHGSVILVTGSSAALALSGERAYDLLAGAYAATLVSLFVPLAMGVYGRRRSERAACASMFTGLAVWVAAKLLLHEPAVPADVAGVAASFAAYVTFARGAAPSPPPAPETPAATT